MKRKIRKKLALNRETIRELSDSQLGVAAGGGGTNVTCEPTSCSGACSQECTQTSANC